MTSTGHPDTLAEPVTDHLRTDYPLFGDTMTVQEALDSVRQTGVNEQVLYFYAVDSERKLCGVIPTRRLLTAAPDTPLRDLMIRKVVAVPSSATLYDACELFIMHRFLAFPVVDKERRVLGTVDVSLFTEEVFNFAEMQNVEDVYQFIGVRFSQLRNASPLQAFRLRFPWLVATLASGITCAVIAMLYQATMAQALALASFLTLALGLGESVSVQSMSLSLQRLHGQQPGGVAVWRMLWRETFTAGMLGAATGSCVGLAALVLRVEGHIALSMGGSIALAVVAAGAWGVLVPVVLHAFRRDARVAAGPITLALTDITTLLLFLNSARLMLSIHAA